jgi:hypothetical protein
MDSTALRSAIQQAAFALYVQVTKENAQAVLDALAQAPWMKPKPAIDATGWAEAAFDPPIVSLSKPNVGATHETYSGRSLLDG